MLIAAELASGARRLAGQTIKPINVTDKRHRTYSELGSLCVGPVYCGKDQRRESPGNDHLRACTPEDEATRIEPETENASVIKAPEVHTSWHGSEATVTANEYEDGPCRANKRKKV